MGFLDFLFGSSQKSADPSAAPAPAPQAPSGQGSLLHTLALSPKPPVNDGSQVQQVAKTNMLNAIAPKPPQIRKPTPAESQDFKKMTRAKPDTSMYNQSFIGRTLNDLRSGIIKAPAYVLGGPMNSPDPDGDQGGPLDLAHLATRQGNHVEAQKQLDAYNQDKAKSALIDEVTGQPSLTKKADQLYPEGTVAKIFRSVVKEAPTFALQSAILGAKGLAEKGGQVGLDLVGEGASAIPKLLAKAAGSSAALAPAFASLKSNSPKEFALNSAKDFAVMFPTMVGVEGGGLLLKKGANAIMELMGSASKSGVAQDITPQRVTEYLDGQEDPQMEKVWNALPDDARATFLESHVGERRLLYQKSPQASAGPESEARLVKLTGPDSPGEPPVPSSGEEPAAAPKEGTPSYSEGEARAQLEGHLKSFKDFLDAPHDPEYENGAGFKEALKDLDRKGAFKFSGKDIETLDAPSAMKLLEKASDYHEGRPIGNKIDELLQSRGSGHMEGGEEFDRGFSDGAAEKTGSSLLDRIDHAVRKGVLDPDQVIDEHGTTLKELQSTYEDLLGQRAAKTAATRSGTNDAQGIQNLEGGNQEAAGVGERVQAEGTVNFGGKETPVSELKLPDAGDPKAVMDYSTKLLNTTPEELKAVIQKAGNSNEAIEKALTEKFGDAYTKTAETLKNAAEEGDAPIGAADIADPMRRSVFGDTQPVEEVERVPQPNRSPQQEAVIMRKASPEAESLSSIAKQSVTPLSKKVGAWDRFIATPTRVLEKIGLGEQAKMLRDADIAYNNELPEAIGRVKDWIKQFPEGGVGGPSDTRIFQYINGVAQPDGTMVHPELTDPVEQKIAQEIKDEFAKWAHEFGIPANDNYITHIFDRSAKGAEFPEDIEKMIRDKVPESVYNPFLLKRKGVEGYTESAAQAMEAYLKRAVRKVNFDPVLGELADKVPGLEASQADYVTKYLEKVNMRPDNIELNINNSLKSTIGYRMGDRPTVKILSALRKAQSRALIGLNQTTPIKHFLFQGTNIYSQLGERYTFSGMANALTKMATGDMDEWSDAGILTARNVAEDRTVSAVNTLGDKMDKVLYFQLDNTLKMLRATAYEGAKGRYLADNPEDLEGAIEAGKQMVDKTVFNFGRINTPMALQNDLVKSILPFQSYTTKQAEFMKDMVSSAFKGDKAQIAAMIRWTAASTVILGTVAKSLGLDWKDFAPGMKLFDNGGPESPSSKYGGAIGKVLSASPAAQLPFALKGAIENSPDQYGNQEKGNVLQRILGSPDVASSALNFMPGSNQINKTVGGVKAIAKGQVRSRSGKTRNFSVAGDPMNVIRAILFGKYGTREGRDYVDTLKNGKPSSGGGNSLLKDIKLPDIPSINIPDIPSLGQ